MNNKVKTSLAALAFVALPIMQTEKPKPTWEYQLKCLNITVKATQTMDQLGDEGWELVTVTVDPKGTVGLNSGNSLICQWFKRQK